MISLKGKISSNRLFWEISSRWKWFGNNKTQRWQRLYSKCMYWYF